MRAVVCRELGPPESLVVEDRPLPEPGPGRLRVRVEACGVNYVDALFVAGRYQIPIPPPFVPGSEVAGVVDALGAGVEGFAPGDRVLANVGVGGFAEYVDATAAQVLALPDGLDAARAATMGQAYCTARFAYGRAGLRAGETVLVLGAGGGIGLAAVDVAVAAGARVLAAASSADKLAAATAAGAHETIDYSVEDLKERARELADGGVDVVYDPVGGPMSEPALRVLGDEGRFVVIGFPAGIPSIPLNLVLLRNRSVVGVDWGRWAMAEPDANRALLAGALADAASGTLHPVAPAVRRLDDAAAVLRALLERGITGKVALAP